MVLGALPCRVEDLTTSASAPICRHWSCSTRPPTSMPRGYNPVGERVPPILPTTSPVPPQLSRTFPQFVPKYPGSTTVDGHNRRAIGSRSVPASLPEQPTGPHRLPPTRAVTAGQSATQRLCDVRRPSKRLRVAQRPTSASRALGGAAAPTPSNDQAPQPITSLPANVPTPGHTRVVPRTTHNRRTIGLNPPTWRSPTSSAPHHPTRSQPPYPQTHTSLPSRSPLRARFPRSIPKPGVTWVRSGTPRFCRPMTSAPDCFT